MLGLGLGPLAATAGTISSTCPDEGTWDRYYTLSSDASNVSTIGCYAWGTIPDPLDVAVQDQLASDGYLFSGSVDNPAQGDITGFEGMLALLGGFGGDFAITRAVDAVIVFKSELSACLPLQPLPALRCLPSFAAFNLQTSGEALFSWASSLDKGPLTRVSIYMRPAPVPLPAAGLLLVGALGGLGLMRRRRAVAV